MEQRLIYKFKEEQDLSKIDDMLNEDNIICITEDDFIDTYKKNKNKLSIEEYTIIEPKDTFKNIKIDKSLNKVILYVECKDHLNIRDIDKYIFKPLELIEDEIEIIQGLGVDNTLENIRLYIIK